jgi:hypothetical protein
LAEDVLQEHRNRTKTLGRSARTINKIRSAAIAFLNWAVKSKRFSENPLTFVPKLNEWLDRRRVRRALSTEELRWFLATAAQFDEANRERFKGHYKGNFSPRRTLYLVAVLTACVEMKCANSTGRIVIWPQAR